MSYWDKGVGQGGLPQFTSQVNHQLAPAPGDLPAPAPFAGVPHLTEAEWQASRAFAAGQAAIQRRKQGKAFPVYSSMLDPHPLVPKATFTLRRTDIKQRQQGACVQRPHSHSTAGTVVNTATASGQHQQQDIDQQGQHMQRRDDTQAPAAVEASPVACRVSPAAAMEASAATAPAPAASAPVAAAAGR